MRCIFLLLLALPLSAQAPLRPRTITEFSIGMQIVRFSEEESPFVSDEGRLMMAIGLGRVRPVGARTSAGGVFSAGILDGNAYLALGPRLRYHASPTTTLDLTPSVMVARNDDLTGPLLVDVAVMHKDKIGLSIQAAAGTRRIWTLSCPVKGGRRGGCGAGLRRGGKPGRIGGAAAIGTVAGLLVWVLSTWQD